MPLWVLGETQAHQVWNLTSWKAWKTGMKQPQCKRVSFLKGKIWPMRNGDIILSSADHPRCCFSPQSSRRSPKPSPPTCWVICCVSSPLLVKAEAAMITSHHLAYCLPFPLFLSSLIITRACTTQMNCWHLNSCFSLYFLGNPGYDIQCVS